MAQSDFKPPTPSKQPQIQQSWRGRPPKIPMTQTPTSAFAQATQRTEPVTTKTAQPAISLKNLFKNPYRKGFGARTVQSKIHPWQHLKATLRGTN